MLCATCRIPLGWDDRKFNIDGDPATAVSSVSVVFCRPQCAAAERRAHREIVRQAHERGDPVRELPAGVRALPELMAWAEGLGVTCTVELTRHGIVALGDLVRDPSAPKGTGRRVLDAVCSYADAHGRYVCLTVTGHNLALESYYAAFGFQVVSESRCGETGDVAMRRDPR